MLMGCPRGCIGKELDHDSFIGLIEIVGHVRQSFAYISTRELCAHVRCLRCGISKSAAVSRILDGTNRSTCTPFARLKMASLTSLFNDELRALSETLFSI